MSGILIKKIKMSKYLMLIGISFLFGCGNEPTTKISDCYFVVGDHVEYWRKWYDPQFKKDHVSKTVLANSDPATFEILENPFTPTKCYAKDSQQVYITQGVIAGADPGSFEFIGELYARDKAHVFHERKLLPNADINSFEVFEFAQENGKFARTVADAKDEKTIYNNGRKKSFSTRVHVPTFFPMSTYFFRDKDHVYSSYDPGKPVDENLHIVPTEDISYFHLIGEEGYCGQDRSRVYFNIERKDFFSFTPADIATFELLNYRYSKDSKHVYWKGKVLEGADPETFVKNGGYQGIDKNGSWTAKGELEK